MTLAGVYQRCGLAGKRLGLHRTQLPTKFLEKPNITDTHARSRLLCALFAADLPLEADRNKA
jgi:hypothetical protein